MGMKMFGMPKSKVFEQKLLISHIVLRKYFP